MVQVYLETANTRSDYEATRCMGINITQAKVVKFKKNGRPTMVDLYKLGSDHI